MFGADNFVTTFIWQNTSTPNSLNKKCRANTEYILCYEKNKDNSIRYKGKPSQNVDSSLINAGNKQRSLTFPAGSISFKIPDGIYSGKPDRVQIVGECKVKSGVNVEAVTLHGEFK